MRTKSEIREYLGAVSHALAIKDRDHSGATIAAAIADHLRWFLGEEMPSVDRFREHLEHWRLEHSAKENRSRN